MKKFFSTEQLIFSVIMTLSFIACTLNFKNGHSWGDDFSLYIKQAQTVFTGGANQVVITNSFAINQSTYHAFSPTVYPWGLPILLSPLCITFGLNYVVFKIFESVFFIGFLISFNLLLRHKIDWKFRFFIIAMIAFNYRYVSYTNNVLSEIPFLAFSFLSLLFISKLKTLNHITYKQAFIVGTLMFFSFFIRTEGIALFLALLAVQLQSVFSKEKINFSSSVFLKNALPYLTAIFLYYLSKAFFPVGFTSHFENKNLINTDQILENIEFYQKGLISLTSTGLTSIWVFYSLLLMFLIGILRQYQRDFALCIYLIFLMGIFIVWPFHENRYLFSIFPLFLYFILQGVIFVAAEKWSKYIIYPILLLCLGFNMLYLIDRTEENYNNVQIVDGPEAIPSKEMFSFVNGHTKQQDVIIFFKPRLMNLYTNRQSIMIYGKEAYSVIKKADFCVIKKDIGSFCQIDPSIASYFPMNEVYQNGQFVVYQIKK